MSKNKDKNIQSLRGMKDILFDESNRFEYFLDIATDISKKYNFNYIETPLLEETRLFKRSVGDSSDIVSKEMYQFIDKGNNDVCLRPEGTAGVVRSYIQNKFDKAGGIKRFFYHGAMFRYERPQKGRLREFHQFGCESFGEASVYEDAMIIIMIDEILTKLGIGYKLQLNSLGCDKCMPQYKQNLINQLNSFKDELCSDCQNRLITNPLRVLDCKNENCQKLLYNTPKITDNLCKDCFGEFDKLKLILNNSNIKYEVNPMLVRGLDYYCKTAFEFVSDNIGSQSAIAGGGRYDKLVEFLGGKYTPAIGFAIGIERLLELIQIPKQEQQVLYFGAMTQDAIDKIFIIGNQKRKKIKTIIEYKIRSFNKHLNSAIKQNVSLMVLVGEEELKNNTVWIKDLKTKEEKTLTLEDFNKFY